MKFSEIDESKWIELKPYLDTVLLPITGMSGDESPVEATVCLEQLRDIMDLVEIPFYGRLVTYPALHYYIHNRIEMESHIKAVCQQLKEQGFKHVILISAKRHAYVTCDMADLWIMPEEDGQFPTQEALSEQIMNIWQR